MSRSSQSKRVALITGCSEPTSLGVAMVKQLHERGWHVIATARKVETMEALEAIGITTLALDVVSQESIDAAVAAVEKLTGGKLDLLINNAGVSGASPALDTDPERLSAMFDVNVVGPLRMTQAFAPALHKASGPLFRSKILNIGSGIISGGPWHTAYGSTKAAFQVMSDVMRREFVSIGIDVITLELALVQTAMTAQIKEFNVGFPQDSPRRSAFFTKYPAIVDTITREFKAETAKAPTPDQIAVQIVKAIERSTSPRKIWLGHHWVFFKWVVPYLPVWAADTLWSKVMRLDMMKA